MISGPAWKIRHIKNIRLMEDSFYWPLPFITEPNREYVIAAVNFYYQRQDLDWLIFVCCQGLESFANTRWKAVMIVYSILLLEIRVFPTDNRLFSSHFSRPFSRRRRRWDWSPAAAIGWDWVFLVTACLLLLVNKILITMIVWVTSSCSSTFVVL